MGSPSGPRIVEALEQLVHDISRVDIFDQLRIERADVVQHAIFENLLGGEGRAFGTSAAKLSAVVPMRAAATAPNIVRSFIVVPSPF